MSVTRRKYFSQRLKRTTVRVIAAAPYRFMRDGGILAHYDGSDWFRGRYARPDAPWRSVRRNRRARDSCMHALLDI